MYRSLEMRESSFIIVSLESEGELYNLKSVKCANHHLSLSLWNQKENCIIKNESNIFYYFKCTGH